MKKIFILFLIIINCFAYAMSPSDESKLQKYEIYLNQLINEFVPIFEKEHSVLCKGTGGSMPYDIEDVSIKFVAKRRGTIEEARRLEVAGTQKVQAMINNSELIRAYLREYPFSSERIEISFSFVQPDNRNYTDGSVAYVHHMRDNLIYYTKNPSTNDLDKIHTESYQDALKIVSEETK